MIHPSPQSSLSLREEQQFHQLILQRIPLCSLLLPLLPLLLLLVLPLRHFSIDWRMNEKMKKGMNPREMTPNEISMTETEGDHHHNQRMINRREEWLTVIVGAIWQHAVHPLLLTLIHWLSESELNPPPSCRSRVCAITAGSPNLQLNTFYNVNKNNKNALTGP